MSAVSPWTAELARRSVVDRDGVAIVVEGGEGLTFGDWERRSSELAAGLVSRGVVPGHPVALRFDARHWADFAVARIGVLKVAGVAVLVPAGLGDTDAVRIIRHSQAVGVLAPQHLALSTESAWAAALDEVEAEAGTERWSTEAEGESAAHHDPAAWAELVYPQQPLARPRPVVRTHADLIALAELAPPGWFVHTWAPGSRSGQLVLGQVLAGRGVRAATLASFSPDGLARLVARLEATACGLSPGLAAAFAASAPPSLPSVASVLLDPGGRSLPVELADAFPRATAGDLPHHEPAPIPRPEVAPVGPSQVGMLWHEQLAAGSFNLPSLVRRYRGPLDVGALERAVTELTRRHEPLRTTFEVVAGRPMQVVGPPPSELPVIDLSQLAPPEQEAEAGRLIGDATRRPFDLVDGPLFAPHLLRLGPDDHVLVVRLHHTAFDDWSVDVFRRELSALYAASLPGAAAPGLPEPPPRFIDVCRRQQALLDGEVGTVQRAFWRAQMVGAPLGVQVPLGEPHQLGADRPGAGEPLRLDLPAELARAVRALAPRLRATPFMTVLAAFEVLLARRTGLDDLVIASVVAARGSTATERMIGCFTKKVLLRVRLAGDPTYTELVARTRTTVLEALAHQDLPFEAVVQDTLGRAAAAHGLPAQVPVVFQGETPQPSRLVLPGIDVGPYEVAPPVRRERHFSAQEWAADDPAPRWGDGALSNSFLLLSLLELQDGLALVARGVFHRPAAQRLLDDLRDVLADVVESPGRRLSELGVTPTVPAQPDELGLLGLRLRRSRIEAALATCPGVAEAAVGVIEGDADPTMVAYVVVEGGRPAPSLALLRTALWAALPGSPWPAAAVFVDKLPHLADGRLDIASLPAPAPRAHEPPDPRAALLSTLWAEAGGTQASPGASYWQDFTFLRALAEARAAGIPVTDEQVSRCRTPEMLAAAVAAAASS